MKKIRRSRIDKCALNPIIVVVVMIVIVVVLAGVLHTMVIGFGGGGACYAPSPRPYVPGPSPQPTSPVPTPQPAPPILSPQPPLNAITPTPVEVELVDYHGEGKFISTEDNTVSTFGSDVDTGSYVYARNSIGHGMLPQPETVRTEEFLNYFDYHYPSHDADGFLIHTECGPSAFGNGYNMLKIGVKAPEISTEERETITLICVIDISGSMAGPGKLDMIKQVFPYLVDQLIEGDRLGIVVYSTRARDHLNPVGIDQKSLMLSAVNELYPTDSTNVEDGLRKGYEMALNYRDEGQTARLLLLSDGVANTGISDRDGLVRMIQTYRARNIYLSTYGFGFGEYNDYLLEQLADNGDGRYGYIDSLDEARKELVEGMTGNLMMIAKDLKIKVVFEPSTVVEYRLVGYDNRLMTVEEYENDSKDSGDIGPGHTVTALYELKLSSTDRTKTIATLEMRYKDPETGQSQVESTTIGMSCLMNVLEDTTPQFRFALSVTEFAEFLKDSEHCDSEIQDIIELAEEALDEYTYTTEWELEFVELLESAKALV